ncbi:hypothetical protein, partial [Paenibacillus sp. NPDC058071]|uniref:hypothetical protein n=1 Tax=Paenibacillus sp. NPDC058071 TaxID=3346326 RepID=UPI0036DEE72A
AKMQLLRHYRLRMGQITAKRQLLGWNGARKAACLGNNCENAVIAPLSAAYGTNNCKKAVIGLEWCAKGGAVQEITAKMQLLYRCRLYLEQITANRKLLAA